MGHASCGLFSLFPFHSMARRKRRTGKETGLPLHSNPCTHRRYIDRCCCSSQKGGGGGERRSSIIMTTTLPPMSSVPDCSGAIVPNSKRRRHHHCPSPAASSSSSHSSSTTQKEELEDEEEDMAKCLILLAQGPAAAVEAGRVMPAPRSRPKSTGSRRFLAAAEAGGGVCVSYECKTCNRCFPSFQALGGHRTSHNKHPRRPAEEVVAAMAITTTLSLAATRPAHECSSCGSVFTSGQALGGHMRRHRPLTTSSSAATGTEDQDSSSKLLQESRINLELDLNLLPAPPSMEQEVTSPPAKPPCHAPAAVASASPIDHIQGC